MVRLIFQVRRPLDGPAALLFYFRVATHTVPLPLQASTKWGQRFAAECPSKPPQGARVRAPRSPKHIKGPPL